MARYSFYVISPNETAKMPVSEEKIRIVLEGLRGQVPISELCRREGISAATYYKWSKDFLDAGKNGLTLSTRRDETTDEVPPAQGGKRQP